MLSLMDPGRPVVIGESVTRVMEGEPFTHPHIREVLALIRRTLPGTIIQITTNGSRLDEEMVSFLASLGGTVIYLSLNSADVGRRRRLMADRRAEVAVSAPLRLQKYGITFHGSIVAMPHVLGWDDLSATIKFLDRYGAATIRVFLPGFTRLAPAGLRFPASLWRELHRFVRRLRGAIDTPVTCEPPLIEDLRAVVAGVMAGTPARAAGIKCGDVITAVDRRPVSSRVDAFRRIKNADAPEVSLEREGKRFTVRLEKRAGETSGLVMDYDIDVENFLGRIRSAWMAAGAGRPVLLLASELGYPILRLVLADRYAAGVGVAAVVPVKNRFFGGSIKAAGLLVVADLEAALDRYLAAAPAPPSVVLVPEIAFDARGRDLTGRSYLDMQEKYGVEIRPV